MVASLLHKECEDHVLTCEALQRVFEECIIFQLQPWAMLGVRLRQSIECCKHSPRQHRIRRVHHIPVQTLCVIRDHNGLIEINAMVAVMPNGSDEGQWGNGVGNVGLRWGIQAVVQGDEWGAK